MLDTKLDLREFVVHVVRGQVVLLNPPGVAWIIPANVDELLCKVIRQARDAADAEGPAQQPLFTSPPDEDLEVQPSI